MMSMEISKRSGKNNSDTDPLTPRSLDPGTAPPPGEDLENQQVAAAESSSCGTNMKRFGKFVGFLMLAILAAIIIAALGVLTLPVSVALLLVFIITYSVINVSPFSKHRKNNETYKYFTDALQLSTVALAILLLMALIVLFIVFRVHSSLKHGMIAGLETWKWLAIALVSSVFCNIWVVGRLVLTIVQEEFDYKDDLVYFTANIRRAITCFFFIVGELLVLKVAPASKKSVVIIGLALWKWIMVLVSLLCAWYLIEISTHVLIVLLEKWQNKFWNENTAEKEDGKKSTNKGHTAKKYAVFMAKGLRTRINILLFFLFIVLTWVSYLKPRLHIKDLSDDAEKAIDFVIRTFLSLLIAALLSVIKKFLLLLWEARELYKRFNKRIIETYTQLYFLAKICGSGWELFNNWWTKPAEDGQQVTGADVPSPEDDASFKSLDQGMGSQRSAMSADQYVVGRQESARSAGGRSAASAGEAYTEKPKDDKNSKVRNKKKRIEQDAKVKLQQILDAATGKFVSYDILKRIGELFLDAEEALASDKFEKQRLQWEEEHYQKGQGDSKMDQAAFELSIKKLYDCELAPEDAECLYKQLDAEDSSRDVQHKDFGNWMKKAHKSCTELGNTLGGAQEAVAYLNKIMIGFLIAVSIVIWLFITKIATTDLIVLLTSPLLAAAFIFGDTAKTVFQGIIFAFAVHPFDVGDMCVIQGEQLEVKKIGIWKTTFYKNGNRDEEVMYPNSTLIGTSIVKHVCDMDLNDSFEFNVAFGLSDYDTEDKAINELKDGIIERLKNSNGDFEPDIHDVMVKEIDEAIKIQVQFKHKKNIQHMNYSEWVKKKNENRSKLLQDIRKLIDVVRRQYKPKARSTSTRW